MWLHVPDKQEWTGGEDVPKTEMPDHESGMEATAFRGWRPGDPFPSRKAIGARQACKSARLKTYTHLRHHPRIGHETGAQLRPEPLDLHPVATSEASVVKLADARRCSTGRHEVRESLSAKDPQPWAVHDAEEDVDEAGAQQEPSGHVTAPDQAAFVDVANWLASRHDDEGAEPG
jgi:hypothetical protein